MNHSLLPVTVAFILNAANADAAIVSLVSGTYSDNFNSIATTAAAGWDVRIGATGASLGTVGNYATSTWGDGTGAFKNFAAASTGAGSDTTVQGAATDRALGIRQTGSFGDPGAAFSFGFSSSGLSVQGITIDLQMLSVQDRSTTWSVQYGIGASPSSFTTLATFSDPGAFGSTTLNIDAATIGTALNNQAQAWFRIAALSGTTGSGSRDSFAIDNFSITTIPEPAASLLAALGLLGILRRRR
jgi:hypothetical protein